MGQSTEDWLLFFHTSVKSKAIIRLAFLVSLVTWVALVFIELAILLSSVNGLPPDVPAWVRGLALNLFILSLFYYYKFKIEKDEALTFVDLLWKVFATGLIATVASLVLRFFIFLLGDTGLTSSVFFIDIIYLANVGLLISFLLTAYTAWKRLILYQKSKWQLRIWQFFELALLAGILLHSLSVQLSEWVDEGLVFVVILLGLVLSANMRWVAFLNFRQKWTSLLLILLILFYLGYYIYSVSNYAETIGMTSKDFSDYREHVFLLSLISFVLIYAMFSFLVVLFNLPTTSAFEQKLEEVVNFQRLSQSIQTEQNEESVYRILLESSVKSVNADAAWLEIQASHQNLNRLYPYRMGEQEALDIIEHVRKSDVKGLLDQGTDKTRHLSDKLAGLKDSRFRSILAFPISVKGEVIGTLALLKELPDGFTKEMGKIVSAFSNQAGISIENFRLMEDALQNERYKEELKIAKLVQKSLLPTTLEQDKDFEISAFAESADEVGGDYFDTLRINDTCVALIIADVSGKGTTAAFHMSQMKGIFHSLAQECIEPVEFMIRANNALVFCLERSSFISAAFFMIDTQKKKVSYARAGHCPILYFSAAKSAAEFLEDRGAALGIVRNKNYCRYIQSYELTYAAGDIMVLYTDGITESKNSRGDEFGYDRLREAVIEKISGRPKDIQDHLVAKVYEFTGTDTIDDDCTTMIIRFK